MIYIKMLLYVKYQSGLCVNCSYYYCSTEKKKETRKTV